MSQIRDERLSKARLNYDYYQEHWDNAGQYLNKSAGAKWYNYLISRSLTQINNKSIESILDVGCGVGNKTYFLSQTLPHAKVVGSDFSETGINEARKYFKSKNLHFRFGDVTKLELSDDIVDLVTIFEVLEHVDDWQQVLGADIVRGINPRYIMIGSPTGKRYQGGIHTGHVLHFKRGEIETFLQHHGYKPIKIMYAGFPFVSPIFRDLSQIMSKQYDDFVNAERGMLHSAINTVWYFLFRYLSVNSAGNQFMGLFEKQAQQ